MDFVVSPTNRLGNRIASGTVDPDAKSYPLETALTAEVGRDE